MYSKILMALLLVLVAYLLYDNQQQKLQWQQEQHELQQSILKLQQTVDQQESFSTKKQQALIEEAQSQTRILQQQLKATEEQSELLDQRMAASQEQSNAINQQINTLDEVVEDLTLKQHQEQQKQAELAAIHDKALRASYRVSGLQTGSMIKTYVTEYYLVEGRFPDSNTKLRLPRPEKYASDTVKSITVSKGGRITIVYTAKSGVDGGAIVLTPREKNHQLVWQCTSRDFEDIQYTMPTCFFGG